MHGRHRFTHLMPVCSNNCSNTITVGAPVDYFKFHSSIMVLFACNTFL